MPVKRYDLEPVPYMGDEMNERLDGDWVDWDDYDALLQTTTGELAKLSEWNAALNDENALLVKVAEAAHAWRCDENAECDSISTLALCDALDALDAWTRSKGDDDA